MARKRQRRRTRATTAGADAQGHQQYGEDKNYVDGNGITVNVRKISTGDEGVLYTHRITERRGRPKLGTFAKLSRVLSGKNRRHDSDDFSVGSIPSTQSWAAHRRTLSRGTNTPGGIFESKLPATPMSPPPKSDTLIGFRSFFGKHQKQYTIASKKKYRSNLLNWFDKHHMNFIDYFCHSREVDNNVYRPSTSLYRYLDWTFTASFTSVFLTFLFIYFIFMLVFGGLLLIAGNAQPNCIVASGEAFGAYPHTKFSDAFALSWTTFTTVGYGMTYTSTASDFHSTEPDKCTWVVFLCTSEAFLGLLFAGMCAAILFGKVNRIQSHANLIFCNAVCLQYEEMEDDYVDDGIESERSRGAPPADADGPLASSGPIPLPTLEDEEKGMRADVDSFPQAQEEVKFIDQFNGCPILKFQVVNELCNREGGELVDCIMKVVGIKFKGPDGRVTHSQYVRVNLVDFEHPFLSRVWHGVHILDSTSPLLTDRARQRIRENNGSWPSNWFDPEVMRSKLEFNDLIVTVAGISNVSAVTVHAYKRYKIGDVLIGFNFAPIVFRDTETGKLDVDLTMCNDVREQMGIQGEDLSVRRGSLVGMHNIHSTIRIKKSKSGDGLGDMSSSHNSLGSGRPPSSVFASPVSSRQPSPEKYLTGEPHPSPLEGGDGLDPEVEEPSISEVELTETVQTGQPSAFQDKTC